MLNLSFFILVIFILDTVDHKTYSCDGNITCLAEAKGILVAGSGGKDGQGFVFKLDTGNKSAKICVTMNSL